MATFTNFIPTFNQTDVARTTILSFTILDGYSGTQINTLNVLMDGYAPIVNGAFSNGYTGSIYNSSDRHVVGIYPKSPLFVRGAAEIHVQVNVLDGYYVQDAYDYYFYTAGYNPEPPTPPTPSPVNVACSKIKPFFPPTDLGLIVAMDKGTGTEAELQWLVAHPSVITNVVYYNIYYSATHDDVFTKLEFLATANDITIGGINSGDTHFFGVRATEYDPTYFTYVGLRQAGEGFYYYPTSVLDDDVSATATFIPASTDYFPLYGVIHVGVELMSYSSTTPTGFNIATRGWGGYVATTHEANEIITLYEGKEGLNTIEAQAPATFQKPNYPLIWAGGYGGGALYDEYGIYGAGEDSYAYKQEVVDSITTDGTRGDNSGDFNRFPHCGTYYNLNPASFLQGQCINSYWGGIQRKDGYNVKVTNVQTLMLQREETLLETTGEPFILLRRLWTGMRCLCYMNRREHPDARCPLCLSTGFISGYTQMFNTRRSDRRILVRVDVSTDDLNIVDKGGFEPAYEPSVWTLPFPSIRDRDVLVRFTPDDLEEFRYEVLSVDRNRTFFANVGAQKMKIKRLPKTDPIYQFPIVRYPAPYPVVSTTSVSSSAGINAHSHEIVAPTGANLTVYSGATQVSVNHNHIIYLGIVQNVLGHTHTIV